MSMNFAAEQDEDDQKSSMDRMYRVQRHFYDLTRAYYLLGRDRLIEGLDPPAGGTVLEVGCGTGRNIIKAAQKYDDAEFFGFDISDQMLATATQSVSRQGLQSRIHLAQGDATSFDPYKAFRQRTFDRVYISFTLSMIPAWQKTIDASLNMLKPDGELHIVDFGQCEGLIHLFRASLFRWLDLFDVQPRKDLVRVLRQCAKTRRLETEVISLYRGYSWLLTVR